MRRKSQLDPDYASFLMAYAASGVFAPGSAEGQLVQIVAKSGLAALNFHQTRLWYQSVLPIVSKPIDEQLAVARMVRDGGRVPQKIEADHSPVEDRHPFALPSDGDESLSRLNLAEIARVLRDAA